MKVEKKTILQNENEKENEKENKKFKFLNTYLRPYQSIYNQNQTLFGTLSFWGRTLPFCLIRTIRNF
jgi:hypothetical protein